LPKHLKAAGGAFPDEDGYDDEPDIEVVSIPATPTVQYRILLDFSESSLDLPLRFYSIGILFTYYRTMLLR
jgi:hypothetical protein